MARDDFPKKVVDDVAKRAGYQCSNRGCRRKTVGPSKSNSDKHVNIGKAIAITLLVGTQARWNKHQLLEASANVSEFGSKTRVRINFQTKTMDNYGCPRDVITIKDPLYYQDFFDKVSKGLFLQEQEI